MEEEDGKDKIEHSEFTPPPQNDKEEKKPFGLLKNRWAKITLIGMAGLLAVIWYVSVWAKP